MASNTTISDVKSKELAKISSKDDLNKMNKDDLISLATQVGLSEPHRLLKTDLVEKLSEILFSPTVKPLQTFVGFQPPTTTLTSEVLKYKILMLWLLKHLDWN